MYNKATSITVTTSANATQTPIMNPKKMLKLPICIFTLNSGSFQFPGAFFTNKIKKRVYFEVVTGENRAF